MLRFSFAQRARRDMIDLLLRRGRLADIEMLNFYNAQVKGELAKRHDEPVKSGSTDAATEAVLSVDERIKRIVQQEKESLFSSFDAQRRRVRQKAMTDGPMSWMADVYGSREWSTSQFSYKTLKATFPDEGSPQSSQVLLTGHVTAAGGDVEAGVLPESVQVVVRAPPPNKRTNGGGERTAEERALPTVPEYLAVSVKLDQGVDKVAAKRVNGLLMLKLHGALGEVKTENVAVQDTKGSALETIYKDPAQIAARQHVLTAAAYAGLLAKIEEVVALHVTTASRYDGLLLRNNAVQMRLSQLACFRYGIETLISYIVGDGEVDTEDVAYVRSKALLATPAGSDKRASPLEAARGGGTETPEAAGEDDVYARCAAVTRNEHQKLYQLPLLESVVLNVYAENALMDAMDCAWHVVRDHPLHAKEPHKSRPEKLIDYPYLGSIFDMPKYCITSANGSMELQSLEFLSPLLGRTTATTATANALKGGGGLSLGVMTGLVNELQRLLGFTTAGSVRLTAPHINLHVAAKTVEEDLHSLLALINKERARSDPNRTGPASSGALTSPAFVFCASSYLAEVFANIAVLYRCTAALTADEEGLGHREWLLTQCFTAASSGRRRKYLSDYQLMCAAAQVVRAKEGYATHPVELMNAAPRKKAEGDGGSVNASKAV